MGRPASPAMEDTVYPQELKYTRQHEWVRSRGQRARIGITHYAQEALGDIVYVSLPALGTPVEAGQPLGEVESTKSVSDVYAPVTGRVVARNEALDGEPELINNDPYGAGWLVEIQVSQPEQIDDLLDADGYTALEELS